MSFTLWPAYTFMYCVLYTVYRERRCEIQWRRRDLPPSLPAITTILRLVAVCQRNAPFSRFRNCTLHLGCVVFLQWFSVWNERKREEKWKRKNSIKLLIRQANTKNCQIDVCFGVSLNDNTSFAKTRNRSCIYVYFSDWRSAHIKQWSNRIQKRRRKETIWKEMAVKTHPHARRCMAERWRGRRGCRRWRRNKYSHNAATQPTKEIRKKFINLGPKQRKSSEGNKIEVAVGYVFGDKFLIVAILEEAKMCFVDIDQQKLIYSSWFTDNYISHKF